MSKQFYEEQGVFFPFDGDYSDIQRKDLEANKSHFFSIREKAMTEAEGKDFFGIEIEGEVMLFPVSSKYISDLYKSLGIDGDMDAIALS